MEECLHRLPAVQQLTFRIYTLLIDQRVSHLDFGYIMMLLVDSVS